MAQQISTEEELEALLCSLGSTSTEVAAALAKAGVKGARSDTCHCPVANWLRAETGWDPAVDGDEVSLLAPNGALELTVVAPKAIKAFVLDFDHRQYPDIDESPLAPERD